MKKIPILVRTACIFLKMTADVVVSIFFYDDFSLRAENKSWLGEAVAHLLPLHGRLLKPIQTNGFFFAPRFSTVLMYVFLSFFPQKLSSRIGHYRRSQISVRPVPIWKEAVREDFTVLPSA